MSCCSKEKMERNEYNNKGKIHSAKSDREMYRICPSKLSKKELEDLYFTLLENNLELKKTINGQQDKIRVLSTQVQRMTNAHDKIMSKEMRECCTTKAFVNEQKEFISELKETNQRMSDRIQQLNMRLCSAKQFSKTTPAQTSNSRTFRSSTASHPKKHNCVTKDQDNERVLKLSTSSQWEERTPRKNSQTQITVPLEKSPTKSEEPCDENKCRSLMEDLKSKIVTLQDELFSVHDEYSTRIGRLETEVSEVRKENIRVCGERSASEHELQNTVKRTSDILAQYRLSEAKCSELATELAIEKRRVAELETRLKAANMSEKVNKTIEDHLTTIQETNGEPADCMKCYCGCPPPCLRPRVMDEKAPIKTLPLVASPKRRDSADLLPKYSSSKGSSTTSQQVSKSSPTKTISGEMNCETCGCKAQLTSDPVTVHSPTPGDIITLPLVSSPKSRDSEHLLAETKYTPSKGSSTTSQQVSMSSPTKTISAEMNCETCGCKAQQTSDPVPVHSPTPGDVIVTLCEISGCKTLLTSDPVHSPTSAEDCECHECPQDLSTQGKNIQCDLCGCASPKKTSTPLKAKKKDVDCGCPGWVKTGILKSPSTQTQDENCLKCCFKDKHGATESPPSKNGKFLSPRGATSRWSPSKDKDSTKSSQTGDDSGYQDTDEQVLLKQNKELMTKILELQNQVDRMKIRMREMSAAKPCKIYESTGSPKKTRDYAAVATSASPPLLGALKKVSELPADVPAKRFSADNRLSTSISSRPLLREFGQEKLPVEQIEYNKSIEDGNYEYTKQVPFPTMVSDERVREPGKILSIEFLDYPKEAVRTRNGDDTRAKTIEDADGTLQITEEASFDKFRPLDLMNDEYREHYKPDTHKLKIIEKKKLEIPGSSKLESGLVSLNSPTRDVSGHGFNPEKLKYLEAEGIIAKPELGEVSSSLIESIPSNPELGFGIPRLASKISQDRCRAKADPGQAKKSPAAGSLSPHPARDDLLEVLSGKLKLPMTEALLANNPTAPKQTNERTKEDCEYCTACSFDKECELKHKNATNHIMNKLAPEMQNKKAKKHDQHNSLQIPGPIPASDSSKREKIRNLFSRFMEDKVTKQKKEDFVKNPTADKKQTTATTDEPANLPDVPLLDKTQYIDTGSIKMDKKLLTHDKKDKSIKQNDIEDLIVNPKINEQYTYVPTDGPISLPDVPLLDKSEDSKDAVENRPSRIVFSMNNDLEDPPMVEVKKLASYRPHSERMLPTLLTPTNQCGKATQIERKADVAQSTDQKLAEKSSQAPTNIADSAGHRRDVSLYRRRSGSLCYRTVPVSPDPPVCTCAGQQDGYCTDKPRKKAHDKEEVKSPRDRRRAVYTSERGTYTLNSKQTDISPDNTELEMSDFSDLPMEKEKKSRSKSRPASPGEDRTTTFTNTYSYYSPPTSLSEGEVPATTSKPRHTEPDIDRPYLNATLAHKLETPPAQQMEAALNAISEELRRCRSMMQAHRPAERYQRASQTSPSSPEVSPPIALRPGVATQGIGDTYAPMSIFTLHIGTVVLSDEAVLKSVNKNLVLKWKFYDQAVTMARMQPGRVVVFDFSTEYDIKVTEDFLHYLKHEEMPIVICELDQEEKPFASCVLPLRDALLHTNTRADMSLALMAGPQMLKERRYNAEANTFDTGAEVGIIDLWCLMRADANMLPGINLAIAQAAPLTVEQRHASVMPQVLDDYNELDLSMGIIEPSAPLDPTDRNQMSGNVEYNRTTNTWGTWRSERTKEATEPEATQTASYDPSKYPPIRERKLSVPGPATSSTCVVPPKQTQKWQEQSEIIINEVNPKIKSPGDIRNVVERSNLIDSTAKLNRSEELTDAFSQAQSSYCSLRSVLSRLQKRGSRITRIHGGDQRSFIEKLRKASANKTEQSKKVTILPKYVDPKIEDSIIWDIPQEPADNESQKRNTPKLEITVLWLALNEECEAMIDPYVQRVYVAYTFLGRSGAELETPVSLPKPKHYVEKCYFNFRKVFELSNSDLLKLGHMARCHAGSPVNENENDCIIFSVVSEPADDPLGVESCVDIGYAYLYLGDLLEYSSGSPGYTEVTPVRAARAPDYVCGVLAVRLNGLDVVRRCLLLTPNEITEHSK